MPNITLLPDNRILQAEAGQSLHALLAREGLLDAPCGGLGTCGKCRVTLDGRQVLACQTSIDRDMTVTLPERPQAQARPQPGKRIAFDIGTTTVVCYLVGEDGTILSQASRRNPQASYGADVISRLQAAAKGEADTLTSLIRQAMRALLAQVCATPEAVETIAVVGNPAMQQLFLGLPTDNLRVLPFAPVLCKSEVGEAATIFPDCPQAKLLTVPDISGFVGADTVAGILATDLQKAQALTLLVDIGTNGELVLGSQDRLLACATAAGPALEGAGIQFGMRAEPGAIDHVWLESGEMRCSVIGGEEATGLCGSGLIDAVAAALDLGWLDRRGRILSSDNIIMLTNKVWLTQADIRQLQLAKGAICAGIRLLAQEMGVSLEDIQQVMLAGAFGSYLNPASACRIGLLPEALLPRITAAGNTAGQGAIALALDPEKLSTCDAIARKTEFLELAALPGFPRTFAKAMELAPDWCRVATALGFAEAAPLDPSLLRAQAHVRAMCKEDKCRAYGKNWTCPPHCGSLQECEAKMRSFCHGILVQTVGHMAKDIDSRCYRDTERRHLENFSRLCEAFRRQHPNALCLGAGGCRSCKQCAFPEPCRFPEKAVSSMEGYGLFVTQVCRDAGLPYHHGERTITYTACILY